MPKHPFHICAFLLGSAILRRYDSSAAKWQYHRLFMHVPGAQYGGSVDDFTFPEWRRNLCTFFWQTLHALVLTANKLWHFVHFIHWHGWLWKRHRRWHCLAHSSSLCSGIGRRFGSDFVWFVWLGIWLLSRPRVSQVNKNKSGKCLFMHGWWPMKIK